MTLTEKKQLIDEFKQTKQSVADFAKEHDLQPSEFKAILKEVNKIARMEVEHEANIVPSVPEAEEFRSEKSEEVKEEVKTEEVKPVRQGFKQHPEYRCAGNYRVRTGEGRYMVCKPNKMYIIDSTMDIKHLKEMQEIKRIQIYTIS